MSKINTVCGTISPNELGITLSHEHLFLDGQCWHVRPKESSKLALVDAPVTMEILGELRRSSDVCIDNVILNNINDAINEVMLYKMQGGQTIVDVTPDGIGRDPLAVRAVSLATGINVIQGTGWYIEKSRPEYVFKKNIEELTNILVKELTEGIENSDIKAGIIGEIGFTGIPASENDKKVLGAVGKAQNETGAAVTIHPSTEDYAKKQKIKNVKEYLDILRKEDSNLEKIYISHMDLLISETERLEYHKSLIDDYGITVNFDGFSAETNFDDSLWLGHPDPPSDADRIGAIINLIEQGYERNIMLSHDICFKHHLVKYGGGGYAHILKHMVPIFRFKQVSERQINQILVENPKRMLSF